MPYVLSGTETAVDYASAVEGLFSIAEKAITMVVENPLLLVFCVSGLAFTGIAIFNRLKR